MVIEGKPMGVVLLGAPNPRRSSPAARLRCRLVFQGVAPENFHSKAQASQGDRDGEGSADGDGSELMLLPREQSRCASLFNDMMFLDLRRHHSLSAFSLCSSAIA